MHAASATKQAAAVLLITINKEQEKSKSVTLPKGHSPTPKNT